MGLGYTMKYLVAGANGQLGQEVVQLLKELNKEYVAFDSKQLDITNRKQVFQVLDKEMPDVVLDAAAYTAVDLAEDEGKEKNWLVNVEGTRNLAEASKKINATLIYISTDYVFAGDKDGAYTESDPVNPKNEYGKAKLAGEKSVQDSGVHYYIIRTSWVFGQYGKNFVYTMRNLSSKLDKISVVNDQHGCPTWTRTLAEFMIYLIDVMAQSGIYNLSNYDTATWYEFALEILKNKHVNVEPISSNKFSSKAYRPKNSILSLKKSEEIGFPNISWKTALQKLNNSIDHEK